MDSTDPNAAVEGPDGGNATDGAGGNGKDGAAGGGALDVTTPVPVNAASADGQCACMQPTQGTLFPTVVELSNLVTWLNNSPPACAVEQRLSSARSQLDSP